MLLIASLTFRLFSSHTFTTANSHTVIRSLYGTLTLHKKETDILPKISRHQVIFPSCFVQQVGDLAVNYQPLCTFQVRARTHTNIHNCIYIFSLNITAQRYSWLSTYFGIIFSLFVFFSVLLAVVQNAFILFHKHNYLTKLKSKSKGNNLWLQQRLLLFWLFLLVTPFPHPL